jgi:hypothetical protein
MPSGLARMLDPAIPGWLPENRERLDAMLRAKGSTSTSYDPSNKPVATFDWDNTMMRNDIGDATMAWMLRNDAILQPPDRDWALTSGTMTDEARASLHAACDKAGEPGKPLQTKEMPACADAIHAIYDSAKTTTGGKAWLHPVTLTMNEAYAWLARLLGGHTPAEVQGFARAAYAENAGAAEGATQTVGSHTGVAAWVRIYPTMRDLVGALQANGFDVWIVSASPQNVTEVVAHEVGIDADHVIGIRNAPAADGKLGYHLEDCGDGPQDSVMTFDRGKRCFINKVIFRQPKTVQLPRADAAHRPTFSAGDSDTDVAFVQDATELKLVINRNKPQLMCNAYSNAGHRWLVQPMFIQPLGKHGDAYPCSTAVDASGQPIGDEEGHRMADQFDTVFTLP